MYFDKILKVNVQTRVSYKTEYCKDDGFSKQFQKLLTTADIMLILSYSAPRKLSDSTFNFESDNYSASNFCCN